MISVHDMQEHKQSEGKRKERGRANDRPTNQTREKTERFKSSKQAKERGTKRGMRAARRSKDRVMGVKEQMGEWITSQYVDFVYGIGIELSQACQRLCSCVHSFAFLVHLHDVDEQGREKSAHSCAQTPMPFGYSICVQCACNTRVHTYAHTRTHTHIILHTHKHTRMQAHTYAH